MRDLLDLELTYVSGAGCSSSPCPPSGKSKNNNGYGNGAESGPPPGNSGDHNPQLLGDNLGPRGVR
jgi:hypothetical protein